MELTETFAWRGHEVRWGRAGTGPAIVFCHGTPWSSWLWRPYAEALSRHATVHLWDMAGYGASSKRAGLPVSLDVQGELLAALVAHWGLERPHVVAHDFGGVVTLRAHLLHGVPVASLALVDVVALSPWGTPFLRLVRDHSDVFERLPAAVHEGAVRSYISTASARGLRRDQLDALVAPWLGGDGQAGFYRQIAQADEAYTDEVAPLYPRIEVPVHVVWGAEDAWLPVEQAHRLVETIPGAELTVIAGAGHLVQLDQPAALATTLTTWVLDRLRD